MDLIDILSTLYESPQDAQRLADRVGLNTSHIAFSGQSPVSFWYSTVNQAKLQGKLGALLFVVYREYPDNDELNNQINNLFTPIFSTPPQNSNYHLALADIERRLEVLEDKVNRLATKTELPLTPRTMSEAFIFALLIIVLIFALRG